MLIAVMNENSHMMYSYLIAASEDERKEIKKIEFFLSQQQEK